MNVTFPQDHVSRGVSSLVWPSCPRLWHARARRVGLPRGPPRGGLAARAPSVQPQHDEQAGEERGARVVAAARAVDAPGRAGRGLPECLLSLADPSSHLLSLAFTDAPEQAGPGHLRAGGVLLALAPDDALDLAARAAAQGLREPGAGAVRGAQTPDPLAPVQRQDPHADALHGGFCRALARASWWVLPCSRSRFMVLVLAVLSLARSWRQYLAFRARQYKVVLARR